MRVQTHALNDDRQEAHYKIERVADQHYDGPDYDQRALHTCRDPVEALGDRHTCHTDCEQPYVTHDVAETADGIEEHRERVPESGFESLPEGLVRRHSAEYDDQQEGDADQRKDRLQVDVLMDDQVQ